MSLPPDNRWFVGLWLAILWGWASRLTPADGHLRRCRSSTMHSGIACVAAPCICPPGARAEVHHLFPDRPLGATGVSIALGRPGSGAAQRQFFEEILGIPLGDKVVG